MSTPSISAQPHQEMTKPAAYTAEPEWLPQDLSSESLPPLPAFPAGRDHPTVVRLERDRQRGGDGSERPVPSRYSGAHRPNLDSTTRLPA
jgi:hypothetical protein